MNKILKTTTLLLLSLTFSACSNMEMGFDEDSIFYKKNETEVESKLESQEKVIRDEKENETTISYDPEYGYE